MHNQSYAKTVYTPVHDEITAARFVGEIVAFRTNMYTFGGQAARSIFSGAENSDSSDAFFGFVDQVEKGAPRLIVAIRPDGSPGSHNLLADHFSRQARNPNNQGGREAEAFLEMRKATPAEIFALHWAIHSGRTLIEFHDKIFTQALARAVARMREDAPPVETGNQPAGIAAGPQ